MSSHAVTPIHYIVAKANGALALASVGIYGVISYNVTQRTGEIGVRVALGAQRRDVVALVVGQAMAMAAVGVAIGVLLALWGGKSLSAMLFGVSPREGKGNATGFRGRHGQARVRVERVARQRGDEECAATSWLRTPLRVAWPARVEIVTAAMP